MKLMIYIIIKTLNFIDTLIMAADTKQLYPIAVLIDELKSEE
jgi:hypothetical protein